MNGFVADPTRDRLFELREVLRRKMLVKSGAIVILFVQKATFGIFGVKADIELAAGGFLLERMARLGEYSFAKLRNKVRVHVKTYGDNKHLSAFDDERIR